MQREKARGRKGQGLRSLYDSVVKIMQVRVLGFSLSHFGCL